MLDQVLRGKGLSDREVEVAKEVITGITNREVSNKLFVSEKTIKFHLTNIYRKMGIKSRSQLIVWCMPHIQFNSVTLEPIAKPAPAPVFSDGALPRGKNV